ncbi:MAG: amidohydrolase family protein [Cytophagales bacterium]
MLRKSLFCISLLFYSATSTAQTTFSTNGVPDLRAELYAFTNATIFVDYQTSIQNATLLIEKGIVKQVGKGIVIPKNAIVFDLKGKFIYPSFIDLYSNYGIKPNEKPLNSDYPQYEAKKQGAYSQNDALKSHQNADALFAYDENQAKEYLKAGFGAILTHQKDGIARGTASLVALSSKKENESIITPKAAAQFSFDKGTSQQSYPNSLMGSIALLRQTFSDANWYAAQKIKNETHLGLEALNQSKSLPQIIEANDKQNILRADKIGDEAGFQFIIKTDGTEYQIVKAIKNTKAALIVPLNFPTTYDVEDPLDAQYVGFSQMKHWEFSPFNAYFLWKEGIGFAFTSDGLKDKNSVIANARKAILAGLPEKEALKALTFTPAKLAKADQKLGILKEGYIANFIISSDSIFKEKSILHENWTQGERHIIEPIKADLRGIYNLFTSQKTTKTLLPDTAIFAITGKIDTIETQYYKDTAKTKVNLTTTQKFVNFDFEWKKSKIRASGAFISTTEAIGIGENEKGQKFNWRLALNMAHKEVSDSDSTKNANSKAKVKSDSAFKAIGKITFPFQPYGYEIAPKAKKVLFKNATVWTNEVAGILKETDVLIENGKIIKIGKIDIKADTIIDASGKHLTSGIIDEHSHIAISGGVNECSNSITAEVRMGDVIDNEDINIYRNLGGGVIGAQILHGSCNSIGGQSGLIKLRWGKSSDEMQIAGTDGFIKFALGENVKQSNFGDNYTVRFPQTRMGVEQVYNDIFTRANEYQLARKANANMRKDLQLDAISEILDKKRFITCHSYVQSEIIMLMRLTEKFNIRVNTFTHILEGYKVADLMKKHGAGASTFSDWWAYKFEVKDAIPYNAAIMHKVGVVVAINSDNAEMARRLNQEAAKAIKYGDVSEEDAWKMVTLNPAKLLHWDSFTGSIKEGKDADLVLWNENPLSIYAKPLQTYIDGIAYFDTNKDLEMREKIRLERIRLINKMLEAKKKGEEVQKPTFTPETFWDCETNGGK